MGIILFGGASPTDSDTQIEYNLVLFDKDFDFLYSLATIVSNDIGISYILFDTPIEHDFDIIPSLPVQSEFEIVPAFSNLVHTDFSLPYFLSTESSKEVSLIYNIVDYNLAETEKEISYQIGGVPAEVISSDVQAFVNGHSISLKNFNLETDIQSYCWSFDAEVLNIDDWALCTSGTVLSLHIGGVIFQIRLDGRKRTVRFNSLALTIEGRSLSAVLGDTGQYKITKTWDAIYAKDAIQELCTIGDISFEYHIQNWLIPAQMLSLEAESPIVGIKKIAEACGGFLYTAPNGTLYILPAYKYSPMLYDNTPPDLSVSDIDCLITLDENLVVNPKWNAVVVSNNTSAAETSVSIKEIKSLDDFRKIIWVIVYPFASAIDLQTSYDENVVSIIPQSNPIYPQREETIEIVNGKGSAEYPVYSIQSVDYLTTDLGDINFDGQAITTEIAGQSLLKVNYTTQVHEFIVVSTEAIQAQLFSEGGE